LSGPFLQLDVGNSSAKWRVLEADVVVSRGAFTLADEASREALLGSVEQPATIQVSSVASEQAENELRRLLLSRWQIEPWFARTQAVTGGLSNSYEDPTRMGVDRWLAMLGARQRSTGRICVVDAGSALTIDLVDAGGQHEGGYIIPGPALMERALLLDTDRVRFAEDAGYELMPGHSTAEAVRHGIALAQAGAVSLAMASAGESTSLFFCGGGGETLMALLNQGGEFCPDLVFEGLGAMASLEGV
jgi:type III pantothenate kinase